MLSTASPAGSLKQPGPDPLWPNMLTPLVANTSRENDEGNAAFFGSVQQHVCRVPELTVRSLDHAGEPISLHLTLPQGHVGFGVPLGHVRQFSPSTLSFGSHSIG